MRTAIVAKNTQQSSTARAASYPIPVNRGREPLVPIQHYFNKIWSDFMNAPNLFSLWRNNGWGTPLNLLEPALDITETPKSFRVHVELPGMEERNIEVATSDSYLTIKGTKDHGQAEEEESCIRCECARGSFRRTVELPDNVDADKARASLKNGVLTVELPKKTGVLKETRRLEISEAA